MSLKSINYSTRYSGHNWVDQCVQLKNQQTCTSSNNNLMRGGLIFNAIFVDASL